MAYTLYIPIVCCMTCISMLLWISYAFIYNLFIRPLNAQKECLYWSGALLKICVGKNEPLAKRTPTNWTKSVQGDKLHNLSTKFGIYHRLTYSSCNFLSNYYCRVPIRKINLSLAILMTTHL